MKKIITKISVLLLIALFGVVLIGCGDEGIKVDQTFDIHTESQKNFLENDYKYIMLYGKGEEELSKPNPITLTWESLANDYKVHLSEDSNFNTERTFEVNTNKIDIINLKINTIYYWYVEYQENEEVKNTVVKTFIINSKAPRNLDIEGLTNVRDLGGWKTSDNKFVKQGMIYRSSRLNENETTTNLITEKGIKEMLEVLNIKSELDIRRTDNNENGGITVSPLGSSVNYYSVPMKSGGNCLLLNKDVIKNAFKILGNESNYPVVIHCSIGTDRTGMLCFLINALLGVSEEDLYRDYLFSNFGNIGGNRTPSIIDTYLLNISTSYGETLSEKTYNYLKNIGVNESDLNTLISLMKN